MWSSATPTPLCGCGTVVQGQTCLRCVEENVSTFSNSKAEVKLIIGESIVSFLVQTVSSKRKFEGTFGRPESSSWAEPDSYSALKRIIIIIITIMIIIKISIIKSLLILCLQEDLQWGT